jgi:protein O-mannosyl-transferase
LEHLAETQPTAENYLNLSLRYDRLGRYNDCIRAAREALKHKPDYAEAYNNIAAGYESLGDWDEAIKAAHEALRLRPDFELARNNLAWSEQQKLRQPKR